MSYTDLEFYYDQRTGGFYLADRQNGAAIIDVGYSGKGVGLNDPSLEDRIGEGPVPRGVWLLGPVIRQHPKFGAFCIPLTYHATPEGKPTKVAPHGRSGFLIHGDNYLGDNSASRGCIVLNRATREFIANSGIRRLTVR